MHPTCSITHLELAKTLKQIATHLADDVEVPIGTTCCGTAGDRGLLHPELVVSATREVKAVLDAHPAEAYISANRTCEMGLRHATGRPYEFVYFPARGIESSGGGLTDYSKLIEGFSRQEIGRLERFGKSRVPARTAVAASSALPSASLPITDCQPRTPPLVSCRIPRKATQGRTWIVLKSASSKRPPKWSHSYAIF